MAVFSEYCFFWMYADKLSISYYCLIAKSCLFCHSMDCSPPGFSVHGISQAKYWSGLPFPTPAIFPTQGSNLHVPHWQMDSLPLSQQRSPIYWMGIDYNLKGIYF